MEIAYRLRDLREKRNLSGRAAATYLGISNAHVSDMENGKAKPSLELLAHLVEYYRTTADYLLGLTDDPSPRRGEALPAPVQEVVGLAVAWPDARQQELLAHAQVLNAAQRAANLGEYDRLMAMFAAAEDGPVLVAMIDDLLRAIDAGNAAAVRLLLGRIAEGRGAAVQQPQQAGEQA